MARQPNRDGHSAAVAPATEGSCSFPQYEITPSFYADLGKQELPFLFKKPINSLNGRFSYRIAFEIEVVPVAVETLKAPGS